jgi:hypothetical protein
MDASKVSVDCIKFWMWSTVFDLEGNQKELEMEGVS